MLVIDDSNYKTLLGNGQYIDAGGERRYLARKPMPPGFNRLKSAKRFSDSFPTIPRSEWSARIKEQKERKRRVSDFQKFKPHDQNGTNWCWGNGPVHAVTTSRVIAGLPLKYISAASVCGPITGYRNVGGYEGDALDYLSSDGGAPQDLWPNNAIDSSYARKAEVVESRKHNKILEAFYFEGFDEYMTGMLLSFVGAIAFNWWSHVISSADPLELEAGSFGALARNNWGPWGDNNDYGFAGYVAMREGKGTPDSGFFVRQVSSSMGLAV